MDLAGRVVVVTDVEVARALAASGAAVVIASTHPTNAAVLTELQNSGARVAWFSGDLREPAARAALAEMLDELASTLDGRPDHPRRART